MRIQCRTPYAPAWSSGRATVTGNPQIDTDKVSWHGVTRRPHTYLHGESRDWTPRDAPLGEIELAPDAGLDRGTVISSGAGCRKIVGAQIKIKRKNSRIKCVNVVGAWQIKKDSNIVGWSRYVKVEGRS